MILFMSYCTTDIPKPTDPSAYHSILKSVSKKISAIEGVLSVYQIGGISSPGISDLDLVVVFKDDFKCSLNIHDSLSIKEKYLFIHKLYGTSRSHFLESSKYSFFQNYSLLSGEEIIRLTDRDEESPGLIQTQIALEYMLKMYVNVIVQEKYRIVQVRSLLLHGKALSYDLGYFKDSSQSLKKIVDRLLDIRKNWFENPHSQKLILDWFREFCIVYPEELNSIMQSKPFYLDSNSSNRIARNISIVKSDKLHYSHHGTKLPPFPVNIIGKKYFRLMNRFNRFEIQAPFRSSGIPDGLRAYFDFQQRQRSYNSEYIPHFYPLTSSLLA